MAEAKKSQSKKRSNASSSSSANALTKRAKTSDQVTAATLAKLQSIIDDDPIKVLAKVQQLADTQRRDSIDRANLTLGQLPQFADVTFEVVDKQDDQVLTSIETLILEITDSILQGKGFEFQVPSRAAGNQLYVPELDRIVLKDKLAVRPFASIKHSRKVAIMTRVLQCVYELCQKRIHVTKR
jgi:meiotic recombination protein SPO11